MNAVIAVTGTKVVCQIKPEIVQSKSSVAHTLQHNEL